MKNKRSAGILVYRQRPGGTQVLLGHPGGPFWKNKREGAWTIIKGEYETDEEPLQAAWREFEEETGIKLGGDFLELGNCRQAGGKEVRAFASECDLTVEELTCNTFTMEWPPRSGRVVEFAEIDQYAWLTLEEARTLINPAQRVFLERLQNHLEGPTH